ncbi:MAG: hypothetical protein IPP34_21225 [Bacteroidetes bacterium]|nr:hypothetical protein [Bacteroidota bacterium]
MKVGLIILLILHAFIHFAGFAKAFELKEFKELALPISKPWGLVWLLAGILFLVYALAFGFNYHFAWLIGFLAIMTSQLLIFYFWKDARFGTLLNVVLFSVVICAFGEFIFERRVSANTDTILKNSASNSSTINMEQSLPSFPEPVRKWIVKCGALKKQDIRFGRITQHAFMKLKPDQDDWYEATAVQYTSINDPAFIWTVNMKLNSLLWFRGCDKYMNGEGSMMIKANALIPIVNSHGDKLTEGTIQRYLGEMVWFPTLAGSPYVTWQAIDSLTAQATMTYKGVSGSGTFYFNQAGDFVKFVAMRYKDIDKDSRRFPWVLTVNSYKEFEGIRIPSDMNATWKLDSGDFTWLKLVIEDLNYQ